MEPTPVTKLSYNSPAVFTHRPNIIHLCLALGTSAMGLEPVTQGQAWSFAPWHHEDHDVLDLGSGIFRSSLCTLMPASCMQTKGTVGWPTAGLWQPVGQLPLSTAKCAKGMHTHCWQSLLCACIFKKARNKIPCEIWAAKPSSSIQLL